ncbi:MAG TPA: DUF3237 family protein [Draconibacterium sp.]|nr:DUF3237 family protein [Draconibacterium sp.]
MRNLKRILSSCFTLIVISFVNFNTQAQSDVPRDTDAYKYFKTKHVWDAKVTIEDMIVVGESKRGTRRIIPITGGSFEGPEIKGEVLNGGEDWQLVRPDGDTELYARYLLKTSDGYIIQITNQALQHNPENGTPYIRSVMDIEAPVESPYDYLNHAIFLGTLKVPELKPGEEPYVIIGAYQLL